MNTRKKGAKAEQIAMERLKKLGYSILETNFSCKLGEIDIIARHNNELVFVEVRSGKANALIDPVFSINRSKCKKIIETAQVYLSRMKKPDQNMRFDVVIVTSGVDPQVRIIPNAFNLNDVFGG